MKSIELEDGQFSGLGDKETVLSCRNLSVGHKYVPVVDNINLSFLAGEFVALLNSGDSIFNYITVFGSGFWGLSAKNKKKTIPDELGK